MEDLADRIISKLLESEPPTTVHDVDLEDVEQSLRQKAEELLADEEIDGNELRRNLRRELKAHYVAYTGSIVPKGSCELKQQW